MSEENVQAVRAHYEAFGRRDLDAIVAGLDPEVEFIAADPRAVMEMGEPLRGPAEVRRFFEQMHEAISDTRVEIMELEQVDDRVVASIYLHGTWRESGISGAIPAVHVFTLRDGLILENRMYRQPLGDDE